jgi:hypothetical protein
LFAGDWAVDYLADALGEAGKQRVEMFERLPAGWDGRHARPLDRQSLAAAKAFFNNARLSLKNMAVFMTPAGNFSVSWEDANGNDVEVEFASDSTSVYVETTDREETFANDDTGQTRLKAWLQPLIA